MSSHAGNFSVGIVNYLKREHAQRVGDGVRQGGEFIKNTEKGSKNTLMAFDSVEMNIYNARPEADRFDIDRQGFQVARLCTKLPETLEVLLEEGEGEIRRTYWPELVEMTRETIVSAGRKPKYVFCLGTQKFTESKDRGLLGAYSRQAHVDFADAVFDGAWKMMVKRGVPEEEAKRLDLMFVNAWKPFGQVVHDNPLAMLDWTSEHPDDVAGIKRGTKVQTDTIYSSLLHHNPTHRWVYLPEMTPEEVWLFKQGDSREAPGIAKHAFHTSVKLKQYKEERTRRSIAVRLLLGFEASEPRSAL